MFQFLTTLDWPGAIAVLGSVIAVVVGLLTLYANYLRSTGVNINGKMKSQLPNPEHVQLHERISALRDRVGTLEGEQKVLVAQIENLRKEITAHDARDVDDFKTISKKVDTLMEIIVEMLKDDRQ